MNNISSWEDETFFAPQDIIIAGSGLVGIWSALRVMVPKKMPGIKN